MVRSRAKPGFGELVRANRRGISNHEAAGIGLILRDAARAAPQDEGRERPREYAAINGTASR